MGRINETGEEWTVEPFRVPEVWPEPVEEPVSVPEAEREVVPVRREVGR